MKRFAANDDESGAGVVVERDEPEKEARGRSTMPERFRYLSKEAPDPPLRWPWLVGQFHLSLSLSVFAFCYPKNMRKRGRRKNKIDLSHSLVSVLLFFFYFQQSMCVNVFFFSFLIFMKNEAWLFRSFHFIEG